VAEPERIGERQSVGALAVPLIGYRSRFAECREQLRDVAANCGGAQLAAMVDEAKLLRAALVFGSGSPLGASDSALVPAAVSIELLHLASLVHDDIIDEAVERRGVPALHVTAGSDRALVVGDFLIVAAFDVIGELQAAAPREAFVGCVRALSKSAQLCCFGQLEELELRDRAHSEEDYLDLVARKTGSLFAAAAALGALSAGAGEDERAALAAFGTQLGIAYQIRDDRCDRAGDEPDGAGFSPTSATYSRAVDSALRALDGVPAPCGDALRGLAEAMLSAG
jgi:geranylgeranyl diphosphate synthase type I